MAAGVRARPAMLCVLVLGAAGWLAYRWAPAEAAYPDSAFYLDGARHLAAGDGYVSAVAPADSAAYGAITRWAPAFPALIALGVRVGQLSPLTAAAWVLGISYVVAVVVAFLLGIELLGRAHWGASLLAAGLFATAPGTRAALNALLSDLPFAAVCLLVTLLAVRLSQRRASIAALIGFGLCLVLLVLIRYAGALYIPGLLLAMAIAMRRVKRPVPEIARAGLVIGATFGAGVGLWVLRNLRFGPQPFGERALQDGALGPHASRALQGAFAWWLELADIDSTLGVGDWFRLGTMAAIVCALTLQLARARTRDALLFTLLPAGAYLTLMTLMATRVHFDPLDDPRFWIAIWPLMFLACLSLIAGAYKRWMRVPAAILAIALAGAFTCYAIDVEQGLPGAHAARGFLIDKWQRAARVMPDAAECRLFTLDARPFMLHGVLGPTSETPESLEALERVAQHHPSLCIALLSPELRLSRHAERRRPRDAHLVQTLLIQRRLELLRSADGISVFRLRR